MTKCKPLIFLLCFGMSCAVQALDSPRPLISSVISKLPAPAEYAGAFIDSNSDVKVYGSGRLESGVLKEDFQAGAALLSSGTKVTFYEDNRVLSGTLKNDTDIGGLKFLGGSAISFLQNGRVSGGTAKAGGTPDNANLLFPIDVNVAFDINSHVTLLTARAGPGQAMSLLGMQVYDNIEVRFDEQAKRYRLFSGRNVRPQIVAFAMTYSRSANPQSVEPIIAPAGSYFLLMASNPESQGGQANFDTWKVPGKFVLRDLDFGSYAILLVRDMRLIGVQVLQDIVISGKQYKVYDVIMLDPSGHIISP